MPSNSSAAAPARHPGGETSVTVPVPAWISLVGSEIEFPHGLFGFADTRRYRLQRFDHKESPFFILESVDGQISFPLIHPQALSIDYRVAEIPELLLGLEARSAADLVVLLIVTVRDRVEETTVNLQGPLVINVKKSIGVQFVVEDHPLRHPLLQPAAG